MRELSDVGSARGAPMGRSDEIHSPEQDVVFEVERLEWVDGDYDRGGAYWGGTKGEYIYRFEGESDAGIETMFVRATSLTKAFDQLKGTYSKASLAESADLSSFVSSYREAALWSTHNSNYDEDPDNEAEMLSDAGYDISPELELKFEADCREFLTQAADLLEQAAEEHGYSIEQAGHDFWLTREGHGAGFWDRGLDKIGDELSDMARTFGQDELYVGDDDLIYSMGSYVYREAETETPAP